MLVKPKKTLGQVLTEDVNTLKKTNVKLKKDNEALEKRIVKIEKAVHGLLRSSSNILSLYNRLRQDIAHCDNEIQSLRRKT